MKLNSNTTETVQINGQANRSTNRYQCQCCKDSGLVEHPYYLVLKTYLLHFQLNDERHAMLKTVCGIKEQPPRYSVCPVCKGATPFRQKFAVSGGAK